MNCRKPQVLLKTLQMGDMMNLVNDLVEDHIGVYGIFATSCNGLNVCGYLHPTIPCGSFVCALYIKGHVMVKSQKWGNFWSSRKIYAMSFMGP